MAQSHDQEIRRYHHGDLSRALVQAGRRILESEGAQALSLRAVAREAGVSPAAPYHHFKDKSDLLQAIAKEGWMELGAAVAKARVQAPDARSAMTNIGVAYVCFARENPALYRTMYDSACDRAAMPDHAKEADSGWRHVREALIDAGADPDDERELELATIGAWCAAHGVAEMAGFREFEPLKAALGGEEAFVRAIFGHVGYLHAPRQPSPPRLKSRPFVTRFAPSPSGLLHRGHACSALTAWSAARALGGRFLLRIEDIDTQRRRPQFEAAILEDLAWLGLDWETPVRRQSEHLDDYREALARLRSRGLIYRCFKTRAQVLDEIARAPHATPPPYRGGPLAASEEARLMGEGRPYAWRLSLAAAERELDGFSGLAFREDGAGSIPVKPEHIGDVILARKDLGVAYHLAVVVDDALQGITHVIRGADLFEATHVQRLLQALLALPTPAYHHHPLVLRPDGKRFAKRDQGETLRDLRARGVTPEALRAELAMGSLASQRRAKDAP